MPLGAVLYEPGEIMSHVFSPVTAIVSKMFMMKDGATAEIAVIGCEGMVGIARFLGGQSVLGRNWANLSPWCARCCAIPRL